jgi:hypothetical protein
MVLGPTTGNRVILDGADVVNFDQDDNPELDDEINAFKVQYKVTVDGDETDRETIEIHAGDDCE